MALRGWCRAERREGLPVVGDEPTLRGKRTKRTRKFFSLAYFYLLKILNIEDMMPFL